jgi:hypothetical protein
MQKNLFTSLGSRANVSVPVWEAAGRFTVFRANLKAIIQAARTGEIGDGRVLMMPVSQSYRICTGENEAT